MRYNYWTNSKLANWIRGVDKPNAGTIEQWRDWRKNAKTLHPIRYFFAENVLRKLQNFVYWPVDKYNDIRCYIKNRWIDKPHTLKSFSNHIKPGQWCDLSHRILPCLFDELVDFVEIETAAKSLWSDEISKKYPTKKTLKWPWTSSRNPAAGVAYLEWEASLKYEDFCKAKDIGKPTPQALAAQEIMVLYNWWTKDYPARVEPMTLSGWSAYCEEKRNSDPDRDGLGGILSTEKTPAERARVKKILAETQKIESKYEKEDEEMLIRLIRVRNHLWT